MDAGIYFPLFIVVTNSDRSAHAVYYLPADLHTRRCSSNVNLSGQQPAEPDGWVTPCGSTCQEATSRSGLSDSLVVRLPLIDLSRQQPSSLDSARRDLASIISG